MFGDSDDEEKENNLVKSKMNDRLSLLLDEKKNENLKVIDTKLNDALKSDNKTKKNRFLDDEDEEILVKKENLRESKKIESVVKDKDNEIKVDEKKKKRLFIDNDDDEDVALKVTTKDEKNISEKIEKEIIPKQEENKILMESKISEIKNTSGTNNNVISDNIVNNQKEEKKEIANQITIEEKPKRLERETIDSNWSDKKSEDDNEISQQFKAKLNFMGERFSTQMLRNTLKDKEYEFDMRKSSVKSIKPNKEDLTVNHTQKDEDSQAFKLSFNNFNDNRIIRETITSQRPSLAEEIQSGKSIVTKKKPKKKDAFGTFTERESNMTFKGEFDDANTQERVSIDNSMFKNSNEIQTKEKEIKENIFKVNLDVINEEPENIKDRKNENLNEIDNENIVNKENTLKEESNKKKKKILDDSDEDDKNKPENYKDKDQKSKNQPKKFKFNFDDD